MTSSVYLAVSVIYQTLETLAEWAKNRVPPKESMSDQPSNGESISLKLYPWQQA